MVRSPARERSEGRWEITNGHDSTNFVGDGVSSSYKLKNLAIHLIDEFSEGLSREFPGDSGHLEEEEEEKLKLKGKLRRQKKKVKVLWKNEKMELKNWKYKLKSD